MRKLSHLLIIFLLSAFTAGCASSQVPQAPAAETGVTVGKAAPRFTLDTLAGAATAAPTEGKVTVLNFWATWCPPCREELPELQKFAAANPAVAFYAVNVQEPASKVTAFFKQHGYTLNSLLDSGAVAQTYKVNAIPTTVVIDKAGIVKYRKTGPVTADELAGVVGGL